MDFKFNTIACTRARYYTKNSPVQFVLVELLRQEQTNEIAVTLTFKNISAKILNALNIQFICKDSSDNIIVQSEFVYNNLNVQSCALFGMDDAVIVSNEAINSVEVNLISANFEGKIFSLQKYNRVALPPLKPLSENTAVIINNALNKNLAKFMPSNVQDGWQCTCGAFNYNIAKGKVICLECETNKEQLINIIRSAQNSGTQNNGVQNSGGAQSEAGMAFYPEELQNNISVQNGSAFQNESDTQFFPEDTQNNISLQNSNASGYINAQNETSKASEKQPHLMANETADKVIRYAPVFTGVACGLYFICLIIIDLLLM